MQNPGGPSNQSGPQDRPTPKTLEDYLEALMAIQQTSAKQFHNAQLAAERARVQSKEQRRQDAERFAEQRCNDRERIRALKKAVAVKQETPPPALEEGWIDRTRFRTADGPQFKGPIQQVEPFLTWMWGVTNFYSTKGVKHSDNKRLLLGALITDSNLLAFYKNESPKYDGKLWDDFKARLFEFCLPEDWRAQIRHSIVRLEMLPSETFPEYSNRARTLQNLVNYETSSFEDYDFAEFIVLGLPQALQVKAREFRVLTEKPFTYGGFENRMNEFYVDMPRTPLGNAIIERVPDHPTEQRCTFPPPKPIDYVAPRAWSSAQGPANSKPTLPTAGRPTSRLAGVAGVTNEVPAHNHTFVSSVSAIECHLEAEALNYGDDPLQYIKEDKEDSLISNNNKTDATSDLLSFAAIQTTDASTTPYPESLLDFLNSPVDSSEATGTEEVSPLLPSRKHLVPSASD
ncbi:hypothetical protein PTTG_02844 [Puccinia triticina 1-1 BBBD Race 1]|uniref:Retrotransposon gag domain-containing protein n=1 Tax=Puccinia triticina (isolate 1-1 / race 1 (BBBD)) TaxID=630390 RepID=A0A0C4EPZ1_PUCT1|nr:hypothetical protein PTTG_02844 [Puccinia triticina 1-1 BBBD Race 1]